MNVYRVRRPCPPLELHSRLHCHHRPISTTQDWNDDEEFVRRVAKTLMLPNHRDALDQISPHLSPSHVPRIISKYRLEVRAALWFFRWSARLEGFHHTLDSYITLIHKLVRAGMFSDAKSLISQCTTGAGSDSALLQEKLLEGERGPSFAAVADLLIRVYVEDGRRRPRAFIPACSVSESSRAGTL